MPQPEWEALEREVRALTERVTLLERAVGRVAPQVAGPAPAAAPTVEVPGAGQLLPVLGRALLGLAGAYLVRGLTESGTLPVRVGVWLGILYALAWLVAAARMGASRRAEAAVLSLTSVLVLSPLLWEAVLRFHAVSTWTAGSILLAFTALGLALSWRQDLLIVATIAVLAGIGTASALLVATRDVLPFTAAFLAIGAAIEASASLDHWLSERWLAAAAADLSVLLATWLVTNQRGLPDGYAPIPHLPLLGVQAALFTIYLASTIVRTLLRGVTITAFEILQCVAAFAIGVGGGLRLSNHVAAIGFLMLGCAAACYLVSFLVLDRHGPHGRNFYAYSTFGIALALSGCMVMIRGAAVAIAWYALAVACIWAGRFFGRLTLQVHGGIYLCLGLLASAAAQHATGLLLGAERWTSDSRTALVTGFIIALAGSILALRTAAGIGTRAGFVLRFAVVGMTVWLGAGLAAGTLSTAYHGVFGASATHAYCAALRTGVLVAAALIAAWAGGRWRRAELRAVMYPVMALAGYRMIMVDLHLETSVALVLSLLTYGAALILLPRLSSRAA